MPVISELQNLADLVKYEEDCLFYSRTSAKLARGQTLRLGTVIARRTPDGLMVALNPDATDGSHIARGFLLENVDTTTTEQSALLLVRHGIVADSAVIWPATITADQKATALEQLESRGLVVYQSA